MDPATRHLIEAIHQSPTQCVFALAGGGTDAVAMLLRVPGGSRTVLEAIVPYSEAAFLDVLGRRPDHFCSAETSRLMAERAFARAGWLSPGQPLLGLGCTATLATDRPKKGEHRFHLATHTDAAIVTHSLTLQKGQRDRAGEEAVVDAVLLNALAEVCGVSARIAIPLLPGEQVEVERSGAGGLDPDQGDAILIDVDGRIRRDVARAGTILPGAFNPIHHGHRQLAEIAARRTGLPVAFELSMTNVDKPPLTFPEVRRRAAQFTWQGRLWITRAPTFVEKARLFPGAVFVVGADTAERIVHPRYYGDSSEQMLAALGAIRTQGCRFLVAGRADNAGGFRNGESLIVPEAYRDLFESIPESEFHVTISSSQLRSA